MPISLLAIALKRALQRGILQPEGGQSSVDRTSKTDVQKRVVDGALRHIIRLFVSGLCVLSLLLRKHI
jgi:hypothetical protein